MPYASSLAINFEGEQIGIAISLGLFGSHLGIAFHDEGGAKQLMHLAWHKDLRVDPFPLQAKWAMSIMELPQIASSQAVALLRGLIEKYHVPDAGLDYGLNLLVGAGSIKADGAYSPVAGCDGFTCSSVVASIFESIGFPVVKLNTWEKSDFNLAWGNAVVCALRATGKPESHIQLVQQNVNGLRLRPEEFAAAAEFPFQDRPVIYPDIEARADEVFDEMTSVCGVPEPIPAGSRLKPCADGYQAALAKHLEARALNGDVSYGGTV
jgi:hypothetical protein